MHRVLKYAVVAVVLACGSHALSAEEVNIGHLETNDDAAINWLYFHCNMFGNGQMRCDIFQTLIMKKLALPDPNRADEDRQIAADPLGVFNREFGDACKTPIADLESKMEQAIKTGVGVDGKPIKKRVALAGVPVMRALLNVCKNPTKDSAELFFKTIRGQDERTCRVHNDHSQSTFTWDGQTGSWITQEGPTGPCGTIVIGTLTQDPKNHFWQYVEKHLRTNPKGVVSNGKSCQSFPEYTYSYTWQTTATLEGCDLIESFPD